MYDSSTILSTIKEYNQLKRVNPRYSAALVKYKRYTIAEFGKDYQQHLKGKEVYDKLMAAVAPDYLDEVNPEKKMKEIIVSPKYSLEDLLLQPKRLLPYVSNMHQSIGKLMDAAISQAISITTEHPSKPTNINYGKALQFFFKEHLDKNEISMRLAVTKEHVRKSFVGNFIEGKDYVEGISIFEPFKQDVINFMNSLSYHACDIVFEDNDIDTPEKCEFACALAGKDFFNNMKEWGNPFVVTEKDCVRVTKQHLISLKIAICAAIVPVKLPDLIERTKSDFIEKNDPALFNPHIIKCFVDSHPWIEKDDEDRYYILTPHITADYQRQGRIIFEEGGLIHYHEVKTRYESIYGETYKIEGIQSAMLKKRPEHDFFPYGKTGQWYYSEDGTQLTIPNKAISEFVDKHIIFFWKDLADVVSQLLKANTNLNKRRIRQEVTNLCYTDKDDLDHFVKKGEEDKYPDFSWNNGKKTRTNWVVNHAYELLKDAPGKKMLWTDFEKQFKEDVIETGRPLKVIEDIKYKHSGTVDKEYLFIRENGYIGINEDVLQNKYNGDLSMVGLYRKYPEFYSVLFSLAMTELRKQPENKMLLTDFITFAVNNIESKGKVNDNFVRKVFSNNENLPQGLARYNDGGSVYIKLDIAVADEQEKDLPQYEVTSLATDDSQVVPTLVVSEKSRQPVTYTTRYNLDDVKAALRKDLDFYNRWVEGFTNDQVLDKFIDYIIHSDNNNLNDLLPQIVYEYHYARIDQYDLNQYMRNLPIAFEALLRDIYESTHRPIPTKGIYDLCDAGFTEYANFIKFKEKKGFGRILNDLICKRNMLLHGENLELSRLTLSQNVVEYLALIVYTVYKYALT